MRVGRVFLQTVFLQAARLVSGVCRAKLIALYLGPAGVGVFAQAQNLQSLALATGSLSLATGYVQRMRYLKGLYTEEYREQVHGTVLYTILASLGIMLVGLMPFLPWIEGQVFSGSVAPGFTGFVLWSVPLVSLAQIYFEPRLIASDRYGDYVKASCATSLVGVLILWVLVTHAQGWALSLYLVATAALSCSLMAYFVYQESGPPALLPVGWRWSHLRPILKVSLALVATGIAFYGTAVLLRSLVFKHLGAEYAGFIQVPIVISGYYAPLLSHIIWNIYHPRLSTVATEGGSTKILAASLTFVSVLQPLISLWIMTIPGIAVGLIYTKEFRHGINTMPLQFIGDLFYFLLTVVSVQILATNRIRLYTTLWLVFSAIEAGSGAYFILVHKLALRSLAAAHVLASLGALAIFFWPTMGKLWARSRQEFRLAEGALCLGGAFLLLQAQLLRRNAAWPFRLSVAVAFTLLLMGIAWKKGFSANRRDDWRKLLAELG